MTCQATEMLRQADRNALPGHGPDSNAGARRQQGMFRDFKLGHFPSTGYTLGEFPSI